MNNEIIITGSTEAISRFRSTYLDGEAISEDAFGHVMAEGDCEVVIAGETRVKLDVDTPSEPPIDACQEVMQEIPGLKMVISYFDQVESRGGRVTISAPGVVHDDQDLDAALFRRGIEPAHEFDGGRLRVEYGDSARTAVDVMASNWQEATNLIGRASRVPYEIRECGVWAIRNVTHEMTRDDWAALDDQQKRTFVTETGTRILERVPFADWLAEDPDGIELIDLVLDRWEVTDPEAQHSPEICFSQDTLDRLRATRDSRLMLSDEPALAASPSASVTP